MWQANFVAPTLARASRTQGFMLAHKFLMLFPNPNCIANLILNEMQQVCYHKNKIKKIINQGMQILGSTEKKK